MKITIDYEELQEHLSDLNFDNMEAHMELEQYLADEYKSKEGELKETLVDQLDDYLGAFADHLVEELVVTDAAKEELPQKLMNGFTVLKLPKNLQENILDAMTKDTWAEEMNYLLEIGYNFLYGDWRDYVDLEGMENDFLSTPEDNVVPFSTTDDLDDE